NNPLLQGSRSARDAETPFDASATIRAVGTLGMDVTDMNGSEWKVAPEKTCKIEVKGTADPSFLKPGLMIRFNADVDKKGRATAPVNELEIVSPQTAMQHDKERGDEPGAKKSASTALGASTRIGHITG